LLQDAAENSSKLNQSGTTSFCFEPISLMKTLVQLCT